MLIIPELLMLLAVVSGSESDDRDLSRRIHNGDHEAFRLFFERYQAQLLGYLMRRNIPRAEAEDLLQQTFITIWENRSRLDESRSIRAFLFKIATNRSLNLIRDNRKFTAEADFDEGNMPDSGAASSPQEHAIYADVQSNLHGAIAELPEKRRAVFELCFIQELTYRETAEILEISVKTVENQMGLALTHIRKRMTGFL
jgi:RNA polymerase sigma-70 factor, ECF subfamily